MVLILTQGGCGSAANRVPRDFPARTTGSMLDGGSDVTGRCEVVAPDHAGGVAPCDGITLFLRNRPSGEERRAEINGFDFTFRNLNHRSYVLSAASPGYNIDTNVRDEVTPGQVVRLRVRATPR